MNDQQSIGRARPGRAAAIVFGVAAALAASAPRAQGTGAQPAQPAAGPRSLDEIVVTARKREERLQDVPLVIEAFTAEDIRRRGIEGMADLALSTPGLQFDSYNSGLAAPVIRGAAQQNINNLEQNVSSFFDGIYLPRTYVVDLGFTDLERIEVIKGPQSARYGRNAFMGAINYVPARPGQEFAADVALTVGSDERREAAVAIGGPLLPGLLSGRASYAYREFDGTVANSAQFTRGPRPGNRGNLGGTRREQYSAALQLTPVESLTVDAAYYRFDIEDESTPTFLFGSAAGGAQPFVATNCGTRAPTNLFRLYCGELPTPSSVDVDPRSYGRQADVEILRGSVGWSQGPWSAAYVYGRVEATTGQVGFSDVNTSTCPYFNPGVCLFQNVPIGGIDYKSHEFRAGWSGGGPLAVNVGHYRSDGNDLNIFPFGFAPILTAPPTTPLPPVGVPWTLLSNVTTVTDDRSWFGEVALSLLEGRLRFSGELRRGKETKTQVNNVSGLRLQGDFRATTPRVTAEWMMTPDNLLYASAAKGIRTGGFNANAFLVENRTYRPEENWTYELGTKNTLGPRVVLNAAVFHVRAKDTQVSARDPANPSPNAIQILLNAGSFTSQGVELQLTARVVDPLTLRLGVTYTDAEYDDGTIDFRYTTTCDNVVCPASGDISGRTVQRQSPWSASAGADWQAPLAFGRSLEWFVRGDVAYQDKQYVDQMNLAWVPARMVAYASTGIVAERWELRLWARNLLDERYLGQSFFTPGATTSYTPIVGERRNYGATVNVRF